MLTPSAEGLIPPKTAKQKLARKNELKDKSTLLLAIPDEHLLKFHGIKDAKTLWEAIKTRFGGNKESKKMQKKTIMKQQYENFTASRSEGLDKTYVSPHLDNKELKQIDTDDLEEMDLKWHVAMLTIRVKRFLKKTGRNLNFNGKETVGFDKTKVECYNCHRRDEIGGYDCSFQAKEGPTDFALMAYLSSGSSSSSSSNTEYDQQRDALKKSNLEIIVKDISIKDLKNHLEEALKEKDDLKRKLKKFKTSSMKLTKLINSQISVNNKSGVRFDSQMNENELHDCHLNKGGVFESASDSSMNENEEENNQVNDRFKKVKGYHAVPPPYTGNYMPSRPDLSFVGLDDFFYKTNVSETISSVRRIESTASKSSKDSLEQP
ncbi:hypothetical protein Tco_0746846 [Tanacetum coccineum]